MTRSPPSAATDLDDPRVAEALEAYLDALEAGRPPDRETFLRQHADIATALEECLGGLEFLQHAAPPRDGMPERLDEYRLLREIGRGGMGVVYEAERTTDGRRVAVKTLPVAGGWQPADRERFRNEARAVGLLDHPNIVPVLAVGCDRGIHYFVMPLIVGTSLAALGDPDHRPAASTVPFSAADGSPEAIPLPTPASTLPRSPAAVARLVAQAAEALAHAHERGIVHRDVKPANCLVDAHGHLWVVDFGLARLSGATRLTETGALVGTLQYMAPEQLDPARGIVDQRTDLYGLGATLYELLTRRPLFAAQDRGRFIAAVLTEDPRPPRQVNPAVPFDLETITLKLLAKQPADRYSSARELAADLHRFLAAEPITARRPTWLQRGERLLARHRRLTLAAAVAVLAALALQTWTVRLLWRANAAQRVEQNETRAAVDTFFTEYAERVLPQVGGLEDDQRQFLRKARDQYRRLAELGGADRLAAARGWRRVGDIEAWLDDAEAAEQAYREARAVLTALAVTPDVLRERAATANNLGNLYRRTGRVDAAGEQYADAAATLADVRPATADDRFEAAGVDHNRGLVWQLQDRHAEAADAFRSARTRFARLATEFPARPDFLEPVAFAGHNLGVSLHALGQPGEAATALRDSLVLWEKALTFARPLETRRRAARTRLELARVLPPAEAQPAAEAAATALDALAAESPLVPRYRLDAAAARRLLADILAGQGQRPAARQELERAKVGLLAVAESNPTEAAEELAAAFALQARLDAADGRDPEAAVRQAQTWAARIPHAATAARTRTLIDRVRDSIHQTGGRE